jgi:tRNA(Ile)-lysidine synthase TilS/MesJ
MTMTDESQRQQRADRKAFFLLKAVNKAIRTYRMLDSGDQVLIAVSGGKDSMTLLDLLYRRQRSAREHCRLYACHVQSDHGCGRHVPLEWLQDWCRERRIPLVAPELEISDELGQMRRTACWRCAWSRRKTLFQVADRLGCSKLAFGHHADDIAQTTLLNLFYSGRLYRMEPKVRFFEGRLTVIRPLTFVEERDIVPFVRDAGYPFEGEPCPDGRDSRRAQVKAILRDLEGSSKHVKRSIFGAGEHYNRAVREQRGDERGEEDAAQRQDRSEQG